MLLNNYLHNEEYMFCILSTKENHAVLLKMFETNSSFELHDRMIIRLAQNSAIILPYYTIQQKQIQIFKEEDSTHNNRIDDGFDILSLITVTLVKNRIMDLLV